MPELDYGLKRQCFSQSAHLVTPKTMVDAIITSPPYMRQLDYARDNRLRLWFLGVDDPNALDKTISPRKDAFLKLMRQCFERWKTVLKPQKYCILVVGDGSSEVQDANLPEIISRIATDDVGGYVHIYDHTEAIPNERRVRRGLTGSTSETIVVLRNNASRDQSAGASILDPAAEVARGNKQWKRVPEWDDYCAERMKLSSPRVRGFTIPSARPVAEVAELVEKWSSLGYGVALWRDEPEPLAGLADIVLSGQYPGYAQAVNALIREVARHPEAEWFIAAGDDTLPTQIMPPRRSRRSAASISRAPSV